MKRNISTAIFILCLAALGSNADVVWSGSRGLSLTPFAPSFDLDINDDGLVDFLFSGPTGSIRYSFDPLDGNAGLGKADFIVVSYRPLAEGFLIAPDNASPYVWEDEGRELLGYANAEGGGDGGGGAFYNTNAYLGVSFQISNDTHYGWIHIEHDNEAFGFGKYELKVVDWAWESEADTAIIAGAIPEPSTGILTMVGTLSLLYVARTRRRKREKLPPIPKHRPMAVTDPTTF